MSPSDVRAKMMMLFMMMSSSGFGGSGGDEGSSAPRLPKYGKFGITVENKSELLARSLELLKTVIGPRFMSWKEVPYELKLAVWATLQEQFNLDPKLRDSVLEQLREQHKTWKKNMRTRYFGKTRETILQWRGSVPPKEPISLAQWQKFIDNEIEDRQLASRQSGRENRAKKTDVHYSGRTSYAEVEHRMKGVGSGPHRLDTYVALRTKKGKDKEVSPSVAATIAKLKEVHESQSDADKASLSTDALSQVLGSDRKGRTRGVSSRVDKSRIIGLETSDTGLARTVDSHDAKLSRLEATVQDMYAFMKRTLGGDRKEKGKGKGKEKAVEEEVREDEAQNDEDVDLAASSPTRSYFDDPLPYLTPSNRPLSTIGWPSVFILDIFDGQRIGRGLRDPNIVEGGIVHGRVLQEMESKVLVTHVIPGKENSLLWLREQCGTTYISGCVNSYVVWPTHLLSFIQDM